MTCLERQTSYPLQTATVNTTITCRERQTYPLQTVTVNNTFITCRERPSSYPLQTVTVNTAMTTSRETRHHTHCKLLLSTTPSSHVERDKTSYPTANCHCQRHHHVPTYTISTADCYCQHHNYVSSDKHHTHCKLLLSTPSSRQTPYPLQTATVNTTITCLATNIPTANCYCQHNHHDKHHIHCRLLLSTPP